MNDRAGHWGPRHRATQAWRTAAHYAAVDAINRGRLRRGLPFSIVALTLPVKSLKQRRDPHNWSPTTKACIDGLVAAGVWTDDSSKHLATVEPTFRQGGIVEISIVLVEAA